MPDASVAAKWYLDDEEDVDAARNLLRRRERGEITFVVPHCFYYEFGNIIRTAERRTPPRITPNRADEILEAISQAPMSTAPTRLLLRRAMDRSREAEISLYDAFYLVVAEMLGAKFVTADAPLYDRLRGLPSVERLNRPP